MIAVDTQRGILLRDDEIKTERATRKPYAEWVRRWTTVCPPLFDSGFAMPASDTDLTTRMKSFGYTVEDVTRIIEPMFSEGKEPVGSMGDDTPLAVMSTKPRSLYNYFKQRFAQVTNPAIDPIRERSVMSLETFLGPRGNLLDESQSHARVIKLSTPILTDSNLEWLRSLKNRGFASVTLAALFGSRDGEHRLRSAVEVLCERAVASVDSGATILILSDRGVSELQAPIPMLLAVSAVHRRLIDEGKRMKASIVVETGEARDDHHFACLIGYGASAVNPYLAFEIVAREVTTRGMSIAGALRNYKMAVESGLLKIMAKMGIATVASYCGAQVFEAVGLEHELVESYFTGTASRIDGAGFDELARDVMRFHDTAYDSTTEAQLEDSGFYRYRSGGEYHSFNPTVFRGLQKVAKVADSPDFEKYRTAVDTRPPAALRDLLEFKKGQSISLDDVEPLEKVVARFSTSGMSHGALSREAHETLAIAMNRLGAKSNSGEGGEDPQRFHPHANGNSSNSRIKQVASARFGVTPEYLVSADELEIKISQGSKPGEGGQLPGHKVSAEIGAIRHSVPGVTLISPPPHHDIYSIEDIAQLIYDLKQVNPRARVAVKLVSEAGVGTVAAGVTKAFADVVHISGHDGGTGASPLGSIKNAGTPWELGLAETQQVLVLNNLRGRVRLRVDGGLKTSRDVVVAAMLGAEEFGFASAAVVALGCVMARQCHLNTCPVGIATQAAHLRAKFPGHPEMVVNFFVALAEEVRRILAELGFRTVDEVVGRSDLLVQKNDVVLPKGVELDLEPVLAQADPTGERPRRSMQPRNHEVEVSLNDRVLQEAQSAIAAARPIELEYEIRNTNRTMGARVAGKIARVHRDSGLDDGLIDLTFRGSAGQSFGAFTIKGMRLTLVGDANDYVGKGMGGGEIVIRPPDESRFRWSDCVIIGNTVMYGATGGFLFAAGRAGERFCVRNSGGNAVVEGVGDHGCEYMTAGTVVILGETGRNFAAGMTGGVAYVLDEQETFHSSCNHDLVELVRVESDADVRVLRSLIKRHHDLTGSLRAREILWKWEDHRAVFWKVVTQGARMGSVQVRGAGAGSSNVALATEPPISGSKRKLG
jgi:glutamate synthase domain-containing protein 2/glutamate synthase domain-containing protein 3